MMNLIFYYVTDAHQKLQTLTTLNFKEKGLPKTKVEEKDHHDFFYFNGDL